MQRAHTPLGMLLASVEILDFLLAVIDGKRQIMFAGVDVVYAQRQFVLHFALGALQLCGMVAHQFKRLIPIILRKW